MNIFIPHNAPHPDGNYPVCWQKELDIGIKYLTKLFRGSLAMGYIPIPWKNIKAVLIHKPGKKIVSPRKPLILHA